MKSLSKNNLNNVLGIEIEVEFIEMYRNQPLFGEINSFLSKNNFEILDLRTHRSYRVSEEVRGGLLKNILILIVILRLFLLNL